MGERKEEMPGTENLKKNFSSIIDAYKEASSAQTKLSNELKKIKNFNNNDIKNILESVAKNSMNNNTINSLTNVFKKLHGGKTNGNSNNSRKNKTLTAGAAGVVPGAQFTNMGLVQKAVRHNVKLKYRTKTGRYIKKSDKQLKIGIKKAIAGIRMKKAKKAKATKSALTRGMN